jgi:hypothetical protein
MASPHPKLTTDFLSDLYLTIKKVQNQINNEKIYLLEKKKLSSFVESVPRYASSAKCQSKSDSYHKVKCV